MTPDRLLYTAIYPAIGILPERMRHDEALAMLLAIALQESQATHRRQIGGPARGFWQFEKAGVRGVLEHHRSGKLTGLFLLENDYSPVATVDEIHAAIEHNDILAAGFARLLLWTVPGALPGPDQPEQGWSQYTFGWRPGKPHPESWDRNYRLAWDTVGWYEQEPEITA